MKTFTATVNIPRDVWDAIHASFDIDFRCVDENMDPLSEAEMDPDFYHLDVQQVSDLIKKYKLDVGTSPWACEFKFEGGFAIYFDWFVEEFGGVVRWGDSDLNSLDEHDMYLEQETVFNETDADTQEVTAQYICKFNIID